MDQVSQYDKYCILLAGEAVWACALLSELV